MLIEDQVISFIKSNIDKGNLEGIQQFWEECNDSIDFERELSWDYIFNKVYIHASLKKQHHILSWLDERYKEFNPIQQIAMRQMFAYSKYLLRK